METLISLVIIEYLIILVVGVVGALIVMHYRRSAAAADQRADAFKMILDDFEDERYKQHEAEITAAQKKKAKGSAQKAAAV